jgi:hypothetical protein
MKDQYKELQKKYKLPTYKSMNEHFELDYIEDNVFPIRSIRRRIHEKIVFFARLFERVLFPNQNAMVEMYETKFFTAREKEDLFKTYEELLDLDRKAISLSIHSTELKEANYVKLVHKKLSTIIKKSQFIVDKLDKSWKQKKADLVKNNYFG